MREGESYYGYSVWYLREWDTTALPGGTLQVRAVATETGGATVAGSPASSRSTTRGRRRRDLLKPRLVSLPLLSNGTAPPENDTSAYEVHRRDRASGDAKMIERVAKTSLTDQDVEEGREYAYWVVALDDVGNASEPSGDVIGAPLPDATPRLPRLGRR